MNRLRQLILRQRMYRELREEIRAHLEEKVEELMAGGMERREAERAARREFGNMMLMEQRSREEWRWPVIEDLLADVRYGLRGLAHSPGFTLVAILTLGLGIGATTAIFSFVDAWLIKPLPYPQADRLMALQAHDTKHGYTSNGFTSTADFFDFRRLTTSFGETAAYGGRSFNLTHDGPPVFLEGGSVSRNFFEMLGAKPMLGRTFAADEDSPGTGRVVVLAEGLWRDRYAGDPKIIGRNITIDGESYTVVGVMPGAFQFPLIGVANLWVPIAIGDAERADRSRSWFNAFGRLKPGVTVARARAETASIFARLEKEYPRTNTNLTLLVNPLIDQIHTNERASDAWTLFWIVGLILLIACANVANLMLAQATRRRREFALRGALGATTGRLARQLITESMLLFFLGGAAGICVSVLAIGWLESLIPAHIRGFLMNYGRVSLDLPTLAFTLGVALVCGLAFGMAPAFENSRLDPNQALKEASGRASDSGQGARLRKIFVGGEIALAVVVLIATTLLVRSFVISVTASPGFDPSGVLVAQVALPATRYPQPGSQRNFGEEVLTRIRVLPGVVSAGAASGVPFGGFGRTVQVRAVDRPAPRPGERIGAGFTAVSPDYFSTMRIGLLKGRFFGSADGSETAPVAIVNQTLAGQFWPNKDPVGQKLEFGSQHAAATVVGVVNDVKMYGLREPPERQLYVPLAQSPSSTFGFVARIAVSGRAKLASSIRGAIWSVDGDQPVSSVDPLETMVTEVDTPNRATARMALLFALLAMFLGGIGVYGVMAYSVSQRTHEIGIRMALGADPGQVVRMVVGQALQLAVVGIVLGVAAAFGLTRTLTSLLYGVRPNDPASFLFVAILFAGVAAAAAYMPARRAMRVNPVTALRTE